jgi:hypothetical protein
MFGVGPLSALYFSSFRLVFCLYYQCRGVLLWCLDGWISFCLFERLGSVSLDGRRVLNEVTNIMFIVSHMGRVNLILWQSCWNSLHFLCLLRLSHRISQSGVRKPCWNLVKLVKLEVFTAATMKNAVFWDFNAMWCFLAACVGCYLRLTLFLVYRFLSPWWWKRKVPPKRRFLQESHGVTSQKTAFCLMNPVSCSSVTKYFQQLIPEALYDIVSWLPR